MSGEHFHWKLAVPRSSHDRLDMMQCIVSFAEISPCLFDSSHHSSLTRLIVIFSVQQQVLGSLQIPGIRHKIEQSSGLFHLSLTTV
jgi:hypothetical protein